MHVLGHETPVDVNGGFNLKFCTGCRNHPAKAIFRASAFTLTRFGKDSEAIVYVDRQILVMSYNDGSEVFRVRDLGTREVVQGEVDLFGNDKKPRDNTKANNKAQKSCDQIPPFSAVECKKAGGCEYLVDTGECNSAAKSKISKKKSIIF